ncbi:MAG: presqualene diphosphate synthase HpnD [Betaproteobacteria bacterium]|jgi:phytoene synthase|nr:presqualene diphosphate synthase HpnD [Betaproteobacteria bacterium]
MTPDQYCAAKVAESGSNLVAAFKILEPQPRTAIMALYAFCREVDDIVDECKEPDLARIKLAWWQEEISRIFQETPQHPVGQALQPTVAAHDLPQSQFLEIIAGCEMDLLQNRYAGWQDLDLYCDRVAGAVGRLSARIFGEVNEAVLDYATLLGRALQYTNIIRDVGDDARRGRIYIPAEALHQFGVDAAGILRFEHSAAFQSVMADMARRAHNLYDQALARLPRDQRSAQRPGLIMAAIYRELLRLVESESFQVLNQRISVAPARKLWLAWKASLGMMPA